MKAFVYNCAPIRTMDDLRVAFNKVTSRKDAQELRTIYRAYSHFADATLRHLIAFASPARAAQWRDWLREGDTL